MPLLTTFCGPSLYPPNVTAFPTMYMLDDEIITLTANNTVSDWGDLSGNGNDATQATAANRPLLSGAGNEENRVVYSEDLSQSVYTKSNTTVGSNNKLTENTANTAHLAYQPFPAVSGRTYTVALSLRAAGRDTGRVGLDVSGNTGDQCDFDLTNGTVTPGADAINASISAPDSNGYRVVQFSVVGNQTGNRNVVLYLNNGGSYTGDGTSGIEVGYIQVRDSSTSSTYIPTTTYPIIAGINGNRSLIFGGDDSLGTSLAVNPTGGMWGWAVVRIASLSASQFPLGNRASTANDRFSLAVGTNGLITARVTNGSSNYIGRVSNSGQVVAGALRIIFFTYDGSTNATGIKLFNGLTQVDTTSDTGGTYTIPTAGSNLNIGQGVAANYLNGSLLSVGFAQGSIVTDADRIAWTRFLAQRYKVAI